MRIFLFALLGIFFSAAVAVACDDHHGKCTLEAWRSSHAARLAMLKIEGSATCNEGFVNIRLYDEGKFLGVADGLIEGHVLQAFGRDLPTKPKALTIKYSIDPR